MIRGRDPVRTAAGEPPARRCRRIGRAALLLGAAVSIAACAPRQAVVESDPSGGGESRRQLEAAARNDLDRLRRLQADHRDERGAYTFELGAIGFEPSAGIRVSVLEASADGFSALAQAGSVECGVFVGTARPPRAYTTTAAVVACRQDG